MSMSGSLYVKNRLITAVAAALLAVAGALANAPDASAAILAVGDTARWGVGGENTLSNLGFNMQAVPDDTTIPGGFTPLNQISSPANTFSFSNTVYKSYVGNEWSKLANSRFTIGSPVYFNPSNSITISLARAVAALDLVVETNSVAPIVFNIAITAFGGSTQQLQTQGVRGDVGGRYFGFYTTGTDLISSITISAPSEAYGFAMGEFRWSEAISTTSEPEAVPEPATIAGTLAFAAFVTRSRMQRQQKAKKNNKNNNN